MTIASEIERLQCAKSDICTAIENKGVTVGDITLDNYACCIDSISTGADVKFVDLLVVGGGGDGGMGYYTSGGGGGGGGVIYRENFALRSSINSVKVGAGGENSCFGSCVAYAGGTGGTGYTYGQTGGCGGSGGGAGGTCFVSMNACCRNFQGLNYADQGKPGKMAQQDYYGGGGGGAGETTIYGTIGGDGFTTDISGASCTYAGGGTGGRCTSAGGAGGGGKGAYTGTDAAGDGTYYGGGGGGGFYCSTNCCGGKGYQGIVILRYKTDGSSGINPDCALGGCKYCCGDYTIHCFDSVGEHYFSTNGCEIKQPGIYHNPTLGLITILQDENNLITLCDRNEGASGVNQQGCVYQRGNNYGFPATGSIPATTSQINASGYGPGNYFCRNCYVYDSSGKDRDWSSVRNDNLRGGVTNTNEAMRGPLAEGFHIPIPQDYRDMINRFCGAVGRSLTYDDTKNLLFFMNTCWRGYNSTAVCSSTISHTWTSSSANHDTYIGSTEYYTCCPTATGYLNRRGTGYQIRAFKNTPVIPTIDGWNILFLKQD